MIRQAIATALLFGSVVQAEARHRAVQLPRDFAFVDGIAQKALASGIPGISIAIAQDDKGLFAKGYGFDDVSAQLPVVSETIFEVGSITKQFTAAAILRLVEGGKLHLDDKAAELVPGLSPAFADATIANLLTHTSGIPDYLPLLTDAYRPLSQSDILALINSRRLLFPPGTNWSYSNSNFYILGIIMERLSGDTYAHYIEHNFFLPFGLTSTDYCHAPLPSGYLVLDGITDRVPSADMSLLFAAGAICSTATDLVRWNEALVAGRVVTAASYEKMTTPYTLKDGRVVPYGYALFLDPLDSHRRVWHGGLVLGYSSNLAWYPGENLTISVLVNLTDLQRDPARDISDEIARALLK